MKMLKRLGQVRETHCKILEIQIYEGVSMTHKGHPKSASIFPDDYLLGKTSFLKCFQKVAMGFRFLEFCTN